MSSCEETIHIGSDTVDNSDDDEFAMDVDDDTEDDVSLADLMQTFFAGENGMNLVDTISSLKGAIDTQNKILMKIGASLEKHFSKTA